MWVLVSLAHLMETVPSEMMLVLIQSKFVVIQMVLLMIEMLNLLKRLYLVK